MTVKWDVDKTIRDVRQAASQGVLLGAESVLTTALAHIEQDPKTGRIYRRRGVSHQASAPGEAPASDIGRLVSSSFTERGENDLHYVVRFATEYAAALEYGTPKMMPRPYARVSLEENRQAIIDDINRRVAEVLRSAGGES